MRYVSRLGLGFVLLLAGCDGGPLGPNPTQTMAETIPLVIEGFPASRSLRPGSSTLLFLGAAPEIEVVFWLSTAPEVAALLPTPDRSPCGSRCAWLSAVGCGQATIEARVCFTDGSCRHVGTARACATPSSELCSEFPAQLSVS